MLNVQRVFDHWSNTRLFYYIPKCLICRTAH